LFVFSFRFPRGGCQDGKIKGKEKKETEEGEKQQKVKKFVR
jgi:hypothetical protein